MARISVSMDADLVIEAMMLAGVSSAQEALDVALRDFVRRASRTEAVTGQAPDERQRIETELRRKIDREGTGG